MQIVLTPQMVGVTIHDLQVASLIKLQIRPFTLYSILNRPVLFFYQNTKAFCLPVLPAKLFTKDLFNLVLGMTIKFVQDKFINVSTIISNTLFFTFILSQKILKVIVLSAMFILQLWTELKGEHCQYHYQVTMTITVKLDTMPLLKLSQKILILQ